MSMGSHAATFVAAAVLASTTAFAQTTAPRTTTSSAAKAQDRESPAQPVTLIGCVQKEKEYRKQHNIKDGGGLNMGIGEGDEYILVNAARVSSGSAPAAGVGDCSSASSGEAFEITGPGEEKFKDFVGKRVEFSGTQKRAKIGANGLPTGGFDPMHGDLKIFEVEVGRDLVVKEAVAAQVTETPAPAPAPPATTAPEPAPAPAPATAAPAPAPAPEPVPTGTSGAATTTLPHTASPLALYELASLLFFGGAYGVRRLRMLL